MIGVGKNKILEVKHISKSYSKVEALKDVSLSINEGEFCVILGASGSGKSTLLNICGAMDKADKGEIYYKGEKIDYKDNNVVTEYRKKNVGFVFQNFNLIEDITVLENVDIQADLLEDHYDCKEILDLVGLSAKLDAYPCELSGGQQQRVSIARALIKKSGLIFCDEPTGALDYETGKKILEILEKLVKKNNATIVFVTHTKEIAKMADHVIVMKSGKIFDEYYNDTVLSSLDIEW